MHYWYLWKALNENICISSSSTAQLLQWAQVHKLFIYCTTLREHTNNNIVNRVVIHVGILQTWLNSMISRCTKFSLHNKLQFLIPRCCKPPTWDHLFLLCFVGGFSTFLYWLMYMPTIWNFLCERKKSLQVNIQMHKLEGFKFYLAPHNWFTHLQASTHWSYVLYQQIQVQGPHVLLQLLHQHCQFPSYLMYMGNFFNHSRSYGICTTLEVHTVKLHKQIPSSQQQNHIARLVLRGKYAQKMY